MTGRKFRTTKSERGAAPLGREWRITPRLELAAATIRMSQFEGPEHAHPEAQVAILLSGNSASFSHRGPAGSVITPAVRSSFVYIPPGQFHRTQWQDTTELLNIYWVGDFLRELADQNGSYIHGMPASYRVDPLIQSVGRILMDEFLWTGTLSEMIIDHGRALIAARLFRMFDQHSLRLPSGILTQKRIQKAVDAINANPEKCFTLVDLARLCNSSVFHFARSFTAHVGCAPFAFQRQLRIQKARELLSVTDLSIEAVSEAVGIESSTSFSRTFRRYTGESPREYRRLNLAGKR